MYIVFPWLRTIGLRALGFPVGKDSGGKEEASPWPGTLVLNAWEQLKTRIEMGRVGLVVVREQSDLGHWLCNYVPFIPLDCRVNISAVSLKRDNVRHIAGFWYRFANSLQETAPCGPSWSVRSQSRGHRPESELGPGDPDRISDFI